MSIQEDIQTVTMPEFNANIEDLFARMNPEPQTSLEEQYADEMSDIEFSIFRHKLATIATEGKEVMAKLGVSSALRSEDSGTGIYTACGDMSSAAAGVYYHALSGQLPVKYTLSKWGNDPSVRIEDGDILHFLFNI